MRRASVLRLGLALVVSILLAAAIGYCWKPKLARSLPVFRNSKSQQISNYDSNQIHEGGPKVKRSVSGRSAILTKALSPRFQLREFEDYLRSTGRNPASLTAVYLLTGDVSLLPELKMFTDSSEAMLCLASDWSLAIEERKRFAEIYRKLNPSKMQGYLMEAAVELQGSKGKPENESKFLDLISSGIHAEEISFGLGASLEERRQALEFIGTNRLDTEALLAAVPSRDEEILFNGADALMLGSRLEFEKSETDQQKLEVAKKYLSVAESFREMSYYSRSLEPPRYHRLMYSLLDNVPAGADLGDDWGKVVDFKKKLEDEFNQRIKLIERGGLLEEATPEVVDQYLEMRIEQGPQAAEEWMLKQAGK